ncbi:MULTISPECIES: hypothetical protein [Streptomyces]|uniref:Uncharacterized protein n=3 Tax=Streptomyces rimosus TaxID=1927 RepID=L8F0Y1_STRR1|nr:MULTISPECIES: hypothetical protein [Streptomyces]KOG73098.1 hypothetical protein ADK78_17745 [Kitasatospora aureofaciens]MYT42043.1 hypothetical protein [Streptomyces sp. SID5471]KEF04870.1 hypothetical protein DF17_21745 [Streptomyces rimosus]KEF10318.1 hypothetical protein DF18_36775 [Streptomyces rimosus]KOT38645.1 hypothetical protein ADK42_17025 [Streptomyces rimosus subsp. rimosus]
MPLGYIVKTTPDELTEIFTRLQPYLPKHLKKVAPKPSGHGFHFELAPFTGHEEEPSRPSTHDDPKLSHVPESENAAEHQLRVKASLILTHLYDRAREEWRDAAYVAALKAAVQDAPARWKTYQHELKALESAYDYLRTPEAAREWPAALSRLIDAQDRTKAAAVAFDQRAQQIAEVHEQHLYAHLSRDAALAAAGVPEARSWHIAEAEYYGRTYYSDYTFPPLEERVRRLVEQQDAHVTKVSRLSGANASR